MNYSNYSIAIALIISSIFGTLILGHSIEKVKKSRYVEVRGLAEREVKADTVIWNIPITFASNSLSEGNQKIEKDIESVLKFLEKYNISKGETTSTGVRVTDRLTEFYANESNEKADKPRYIFEKEVIVKSDKIENVTNANQNISSLLNDGVMLRTYKGPKYFYTKLNDIKPEMLAESIKQAGKAAEEFAIISNSKVGKIKIASQGRFSIVSREAEVTSGSSSYYDEEDFINKTVRVISTIEYYLED